MNKAVIFIIFCIAVAVLTLVLIFANKKSDDIGTTERTDRVFYYGSTCPHCKIVEEFAKDNNVKSKYNYSEKEVYGSKTNAQELIKRGRECGLDEKDIGAVPLLWDSGVCYLGDQPIINYFKEQIGENNENNSSSSATLPEASSSSASSF